MANGVTFRRIHGRIVPVRLKQEDKRDLTRIGVAAAVGAAAALATGRFGPPGGFAGASAKVRKTAMFHVSRAFGAVALGSGAVVASSASRIVARRHGEDAGAVGGTLAGAGAAVLFSKAAAMGGTWRTVSRLRYALKGTKWIRKVFT